MSVPVRLFHPRFLHSPDTGSQTLCTKEFQLIERQLQFIQSWFSDYVSELIPGDEKITYLMKLKVAHSTAVADLAELIARELSWSPGDQRLAKAAGLVHDTGRFPQLVEYHTFSDTTSVNHGERGYLSLQECGALESLDETERISILESVRYHNARSLPAHIDGKSLAMLKLVRDSDKIDIFRVLNNAIVNNHREDYPEIFLNIDFTGPVNPRAYEQVLLRETVSYEHLKSLADLCLTQLSWIFDINYIESIRFIIEEHLIEQVMSYAPRLPEIEETAAAVRFYMDERLLKP
jgi:hypothetical protein